MKRDCVSETLPYMADGGGFPLAMLQCIEPYPNGLCRLANKGNLVALRALGSVGKVRDDDERMHNRPNLPESFCAKCSIHKLLWLHIKAVPLAYINSLPLLI